MVDRDPESADEARHAVMSAVRCELWHLGHALDRDGEPFPGPVSAQLLADILQVGEVENWPRSTRKNEAKAVLFAPLATIPKDDGKTYRTFLPEDLRSEDEVPLRVFAEATENPFVKARVFEVLWDRFQKHGDARQAITARLASAALADAEEDWPQMVRNLGRLATLLLRLNARDQIGPTVDAMEAAADALLECSRPFSFPVLADMVCNTLLVKKEHRESFSAERSAKWTERLEGVAAKYRGDPHHGNDALVVLHAWQARWGEQEKAMSTKRRIVGDMLDLAKRASADIAPDFADRALRQALEFGIPDLAHAARTELGAAIRAAMPTFSRMSMPFSLPPELLRMLDSVLEDAPSRAAAIRQLALTPGLLELDKRALQDKAHAQLKESPFYALCHKVRYHPDGRISHRTSSLEESIEWDAAMLAGFHLAQVEGMLGYFLRQSFSGFCSTTLLDALASWPHLSASRRAMLEVASNRFHAQDWVSAGCLAATTYEAVLRDLLRAGGYAALKIEADGTQMDEALNSLMRQAATKSVLGEAHCCLVEHVLCDPSLGWNLRNEVAHGTVRPDALTPARVLLIWLLIIRVTSFFVDATRPGGEAENHGHSHSDVAPPPPPKQEDDDR